MKMLKMLVMELVEFSVNFHDGRIVEMQSKLNHYAENGKHGDNYSLCIKIEDVYFAEPKYKPESVVADEGCKFKGIEMLFDGVEKLFFAPEENHEFMFIFHALLVMKDDKFIFNAFDYSEKLKSEEACNLYISAEKLSYKIF